MNKVNEVSFKHNNEHRPQDTHKKKTPQGLAAIPDTTSSATNVVFMLLGENLKNEKVSQEITKLHGARTVQQQKETSKTKQERLEILRDKALKLQSAENWGMLSDVAYNFSIAYEILLGIGDLTTGGTVTGSLILASAGLGASNSLIHSLGGWDQLASLLTSDEKTKQQLASYFNDAVFYLTTGASLATLGYSYTTGALQQISNRANELISGALALSSGTANVMASKSKYQVAKMDAVCEDLKKLEITTKASANFLSQKIEETADDRKAIQEKLRAILILQNSRI
ncbi:MAG: hypothetical protein PVI40_06965 [Chlamydiota bacterium]|jgi:hypothetical protein